MKFNLANNTDLNIVISKIHKEKPSVVSFISDNRCYRAQAAKVVEDSGFVIQKKEAGNCITLTLNNKNMKIVKEKSIKEILKSKRKVLEN